MMLDIRYQDVTVHTSSVWRVCSNDHPLSLLVSAEDEKVTAYDLANDRHARQRATGWKLHHFSSQLEEMVSHIRSCASAAHKGPSEQGGTTHFLTSIPLL